MHIEIVPMGVYCFLLRLIHFYNVNQYYRIKKFALYHTNELNNMNENKIKSVVQLLILIFTEGTC